MDENKTESQITQANNQFASDLYTVLSKNKQNIIFSPISVHTILSMSHQGAKGTTADQLASTLHLLDPQTSKEGYSAIINKLSQSESIALHIAHKIYVKENYEILEDFKDVLSTNFLAEIENVNFAEGKTAEIINKWVENQTNKEICNLVEEKMLNASTKLVLVNAIYFKGTWKNKFAEEETFLEPFYVGGEETVDVQMMHICEDFGYKYDTDLCAKVLQMPYMNEDFSMIIISPGRDRIEDLEKALSRYDLSKITQDLDECNVIVALPKFKVETTLNLEEPLSELGLGVIFDQSEANFGGMVEMGGDENLHVGKILHKAFIEVDEKGTAAVAATLESKEMFMKMPPEVMVDHPFIFLVKMKEMILFVGKVVLP